MHYTVNNNRINLSNIDTCSGHIDSIRDLLFHGNFMKRILVNIYWYTCWLKHSSRLIFHCDFIHHLDYTFYIILLYWLRARITGVILIYLQFFT